MPRILIADDQADVLAALSLLLKGERFQIESASSPEGVLRTIDTHEFDVVLIDLNYARDTTSGSEGLDLLSRIRALDPTLPVVVMTAWGSVDLAVEAMRRGARDFIQKPWDNARLLAVLRTQVELGEALRRGKRLEAENIALRHSVAESSSELPQIVSESPAMRSVLNLVEKQRAAISEFKAAYPITLRVSESAAHVAKQFTFENSFSECARVQRDQRLRATRRD